MINCNNEDEKKLINEVLDSFGLTPPEEIESNLTSVAIAATIGYEATEDLGFIDRTNEINENEIPNTLFIDYIGINALSENVLSNPISVGSTRFYVYGKSYFDDSIELNANLSVSGLTSTSNLFVSGVTSTSNLVVSGVTSTSNLFVSGVTTTSNLVVSGLTNTSNLVVSGVTTTSNLVVSGVTSTSNLVISGVTTTSNLVVSGVTTFNGSVAFNGGTSGSTAPFTVDSNTVVTNLNSDLLDGQDGTYYLNTSNIAQTKSGNLTINGRLGINSSLLDSYNSAGTTGKILSSTGIGVSWIDLPTDADTVDGLHASQFLRSDVSDIFEGSILTINASSSSNYFEVRHGTDTDINLRMYCESAGAAIGNFTSLTDKKYISFSNPNGSNDPGYIMHETSGSTGNTDIGVLHLCPSDNNSSTDYVSIHGTNQSEALRLYTNATIQSAGSSNLTLTTASGLGRVIIGSYYLDVNGRLRDNGGSQGSNGQILSSTGDGISWVSPVTGYKNHIINGNFSIWKRGTSFSGTGQFFTADRWYIATDNTAATLTISRGAFTTAQITTFGSEASRYYLRFAKSANTAGTYLEIRQYIEDVTVLANQTVTISFWARASTTITIGSIKLVRRFTSSLDATDTFQASQTINTAWAKYSYTGTVGAVTSTPDDDSSLQLAIGLQRTSTSYAFEIANVQIESGSLATNFEKRSIAVEESLCSRYFLGEFEPRTYIGIATGTANIWYPFPQEMRRVPDVTYTLAVGTSPSVASVTTKNISITGTVTTAGSNNRFGVDNLRLSAEYVNE
jgi:hypothetical protein